MSHSPSISRRRLLTALALSPLLWQLPRAQAANTAIDPHKIVTLEWLPTELLLALGITPYGMADIPNYNLWVGEPAIPASVIDVGLRTEPNLELLTQMQPSQLFWSTGYGPSPEILTRIAPGRGFSFSDGVDPLAMARNSLLSMAQQLGQQQAAQAHLESFETLMAQLKPRFAGRAERPLLMLSLLDARHALVFGSNSLFQGVLNRLNIRNAWHGETNFWGSVAVGIDRLAAFKDVDVVYFDHGNDHQMQQLVTTPLWQSMPFVRSKRITRLPAVWFYGATLSAMHFARQLDNALGGRA